jgi:hypothetical protein
MRPVYRVLVKKWLPVDDMMYIHLQRAGWQENVPCYRVAVLGTMQAWRIVRRVTRVLVHVGRRARTGVS